jgi:hypothetical protein
MTSEWINRQHEISPRTNNSRATSNGFFELVSQSVNPDNDKNNKISLNNDDANIKNHRRKTQNLKTCNFKPKWRQIILKNKELP